MLALQGPPSSSSALSSRRPDEMETAASSAMIGVVVPCYKVTEHILHVLANIGPEVSRIYAVDDHCPDGSGKLVESSSEDERI